MDWRFDWKLAGSAFGIFLTRYLPAEGVAIVVVLILLDWLTGILVSSRTGTFTVEGLRKGARKLIIWSIMLALSATLRYHWDSEADWVYKILGDYLIFYIVLTETISVVRNCLLLAVLDDLRFPGLEQLLGALQSWGDKGLEKMRQKIAPPVVVPALCLTCPAGPNRVAGQLMVICAQCPVSFLYKQAIQDSGPPATAAPEGGHPDGRETDKPNSGGGPVGG